MIVYVKTLVENHEFILSSYYYANETRNIWADGDYRIGCWG